MKTSYFCSERESLTGGCFIVRLIIHSRSCVSYSYLLTFLPHERDDWTGGRLFSVKGLWDSLTFSLRYAKKSIVLFTGSAFSTYAFITHLANLLHVQS
jgi:hypothetical protein